MTHPLLWSTLALGSVGYVAIGTVVITVVRRQTTINTVSLLYMAAAGIIMSLSQFFLPFAVLRLGLMEDYLYRQLYLIMADRPGGWSLPNQIVLAVIVSLWVVGAVSLFARQGMAISRAR